MKTLFLLMGLLLVPVLGWAQAVMNPAALAQLAGAPPVRIAMLLPPPAPMLPVARRHWRRVVYKSAARRPVVAASRPVVPVVATVRPPVVAKVPPVVGPVVVEFAPGSAALPADAAAALRPLCGVPGEISVAAAAPGDMSAAMRLSMDRAFAVRDALTACGVPSARILPRALGAVALAPDAARVTVAP